MNLDGHRLIRLFRDNINGVTEAWNVKEQSQEQIDPELNSKSNF